MSCTAIGLRGFFDLMPLSVNVPLSSRRRFARVAAT